MGTEAKREDESRAKVQPHRIGTRVILISTIHSMYGENMATFIDEGDDAQQEEFNSFDEEEDQEVDDPEEDTPEPDEEDDLPEKYRGKSVKDIVRMHQEAERAMGKQGSEVGELRRVVDDFVKAQTVKKAPDVEEEIDFFSDPDKAVARAIENHPKIRQAEQYSTEMARSKAAAKLQEDHPDFKEIIDDASFSEWITKSNVRKELFQRADQQFDFDAADELLTNWKERKQVVSNTVQAEKKTRSNAIKAASTGSAQGSGENSKKIYLRTDIIDLMQRNPDRYQELQPYIMAAYAEGRVR
tara:strand:- start:60 stop:956 length:897 start_codon:yes stop_codon:yes gene_type:complete